MDPLLEAALDTSCLTVVQHAQAQMLDILKVIEVRAKRKKKVDHRTLKRKKRRAFDHGRALICIRNDLTGPDALFVGQEFKMFFRVSRVRFQNMLEMFGNHGGKFYSGKPDCVGNPTASLEAKLLLPLQTLAFGVATHTFCLYYQMSNTLARECCRQFNKKFLSLYRNKYLKRPSVEDMVRISKLHEAVHGFPGMFGSLDCMHTRWEKCPVGWQGSFKGRPGYPSIVLEAVADYHTYFWHIDYGHAGTNNDINILHSSDFYASFLDGRMEELEKHAVPFYIANKKFNKMYVLVDGVYPKFDRFVLPFPYPVYQAEIKFGDWQAAARKDVERAFGILQGEWQAVARPIRSWSLTDIATMVKCCLCLHNMLVSDRVMHGNVTADYDPLHDLQGVDGTVQQCSLYHSVYRAPRRSTTTVGVAAVRDSNPAVFHAVTRKERFQGLYDEAEHERLLEALLSEHISRLDVNET
jgi:Plant transposon protein